MTTCHVVNFYLRPLSKNVKTITVLQLFCCEMKKLMYHDQDNVFDLGVLQANNNMQQKLMLDLMYYFFQTKEEDRKEVYLYRPLMVTME